MIKVEKTILEIDEKMVNKGKLEIENKTNLLFKEIVKQKIEEKLENINQNEIIKLNMNIKRNLILLNNKIMERDETKNKNQDKNISFRKNIEILFSSIFYLIFSLYPLFFMAPKRREERALKK